MNEKEQTKTIRQLSDEYNLTKGAILARINKMLAEVKQAGEDEAEYIIRGKQNTIYVKPKGIDWLASWNDANTPMQEPVKNIDLELYKLQQAELRIKDLEEQLFDMRQDYNFLQTELTKRTQEVSNLTETIDNQSKVISSQNAQIFALTAEVKVQEEPQPETKAPDAEPSPDTLQNASEASETDVSISDDKIVAELSKRGFMDKIRLLFRH